MEQSNARISLQSTGPASLQERLSAVLFDGVNQLNGKKLVLREAVPAKLVLRRPRARPRCLCS